MLIPVTKDLPGVIGGSWEVVINLFSDLAGTQPLDLTQTYEAATIALEIDGVATLTPTSGLTITAQSGQIAAVMNPTVTATAPESSRWRLKLPRLDGGTDFAASGTVFWRAP